MFTIYDSPQVPLLLQWFPEENGSECVQRNPEGRASSEECFKLTIRYLIWSQAQTQGWCVLHNRKSGKRDDEVNGSIP